jgi:hypothetical protein
MSRTNSFEEDYLQLMFQNANVANIGDATGLRGSSSAGSFYIALFTADPGEAGSTSNEATYTGYARVAVARNSSNWTVSGNNASNTNAITFAECTGGSNTVTHVAIMTALTGGDMIFYGALTSALAISSGVTAEFAAGVLDITAD